MPKYRFSWLNNGAEIVNPELTVNADNLSIFPSNMTIDVDIVLSTPQASFGMRLLDVHVANLDYDETTLVQRVLDKLKEYEL